ncbi:MAG: hypothetical protein IJ088_04910 [Clostridia bacterium]|nr:hypothetical protein [Clostridia bacterium]
MTESQRIWAEARDRLVASITALGYSKELGVLIAEQLKSPRAMDRMNAYVKGVRPTSEEMLVDEMLAICSDVDAWKERKKSQEAQARYNAWLVFGRPDEEEDE